MRQSSPEHSIKRNVILTKEESSAYLRIDENDDELMRQSSSEHSIKRNVILTKEESNVYL